MIMDIQKEIDRLSAEVKGHEQEIAALRDQVNTKNKKLRKLKSLVDEAAELLGESSPVAVVEDAAPVDDSAHKEEVFPDDLPEKTEA